MRELLRYSVRWTTTVQQCGVDQPSWLTPPAPREDIDYLWPEVVYLAVERHQYARDVPFQLPTLRPLPRNVGASIVPLADVRQPAAKPHTDSAPDKLRNIDDHRIMPAAVDIVPGRNEWTDVWIVEVSETLLASILVGCTGRGLVAKGAVSKRTE